MAESAFDIKPNLASGFFSALERSGISDAARMNADLLSELVEKTSVMQAHPPSSLIYHHGMPSKQPPHWMQGRHVIGYWVCESSEANADYKAAMDAHTQIWTASTASAEDAAMHWEGDV